MKRFIKRLIPVTLLLLLVAGVGSLMGGDKGGPAYRTEQVSKGDIVDVVSSSGTLNPIQLVTVGTQVSGQVNKINVVVNDQVKAGQVLAEIDPQLLKAQLRQDQSGLETAQVNFQQAERDLKRMRDLLAKDYVAKVDLERAQQAYQQARNSYESSKSIVERDKVNLGYATISAPIDGVVISTDVTLGQTVAASFQTPTLFKIAGDLTKMKIDVNLAEADISKVKVDMPVTFSVDAFPDRVFDGKVMTINLNPNNQQGVVTYLVSVSVENPDKVLLPGMTAYVSVTLSKRANVLRVPASALRFTPPPESSSGLKRLFSASTLSRPRSNQAAMVAGAKIHSLYVLRDDHLTQVMVDTGSSNETYVEVSGKDIAEGDVVVTGLMPVRH